MNSSGPAFKRCRPLLGTFVEVKLFSAERVVEAESALAWSDAAFAVIERLQGLLSYHDEASDLNRLNGAPLRAWLSISPELWEVLALALRLQDLTAGVFNAAIAEPLVRWGYLPGAATTRQSWRYLAGPAYELRDGEARRVLPARIDLGGIAKGYAVDAAVGVLQKLCPPDVSGVVNAGGDLRVFGPQTQPALMRTAASGLAVELQIHDCALATSSVQPQPGPGRHLVSPYIDLRQRQPLQSARTAVVRAPSCVVADALTKVALLAPAKLMERVAAHFNASFSVLPC